MLQKRVDDRRSISQAMVREAESLFHDHLWRVGLKHTGQRDIILRTFLDTHDHLSTDELYRLVKKLDAHIGFTTVYRTLKLLAECGLASEVAFHDGRASVQPAQSPSHGLHSVRQLGGVFFTQDRTRGTRGRTETQVRNDPAHFPGLRPVREVPEGTAAPFVTRKPPTLAA